MRIFLDSSALAKRYLRESGTDAINSLCRKSSEILLSVLSVPEMLSAFNRLLRERHISKKQYRQLKNNFLNDVSETTLVGLSEDVIAKAILCIEKVPVRTLDALHIASALQQEPDMFITADKMQNKAAGVLGLKQNFIA